MQRNSVLDGRLEREYNDAHKVRHSANTRRIGVGNCGLYGATGVQSMQCAARNVNVWRLGRADQVAGSVGRAARVHIYMVAYRIYLALAICYARRDGGRGCMGVRCVCDCELVVYGWEGVSEVAIDVCVCVPSMFGWQNVCAFACVCMCVCKSPWARLAFGTCVCACGVGESRCCCCTCGGVVLGLALYTCAIYIHIYSYKYI